MEAIGGVLVFAGLGAAVIGLVSVIHPLRRLRIPTRRFALGVFAAGIVTLGVGGSLLPTPPTRESAEQRPARGSTPTDSAHTPAAATPQVSGATAEAPSTRAVAAGPEGPSMTVTRVVDGDTIEVSVGGRTDTVRLILVDTPEVFGGVECYGQEASAFTKSLVPVGTHVTLERDVSDRDRYDRLLRYVWLPDARMLNEVLVSEGYAQLATFPPDVRYVERIRVAEQQARASGRGLWQACTAAGASGAGTTPTPGVSSPTAPVITPAATPVTTPAASVPVQSFRNCAELNAVYPGGVARVGVTGNTVSGVLRPFGRQPVFDDALYAANSGRDGDDDGIACEQ